MDSDRTKKEQVIDQLLEGYKFATQLRLLLSKKPFVDDHRRYDRTRLLCWSGSGSCSRLGSADELLAKILRSFDKTISALDSFEHAPGAAAVAAGGGSRNTSCDDSVAPGFYDRRCEDSGDSRKRLLRPINKGKRGCYKRKRETETRIIESATLEDAHGWRKYGQKEILKSKHPRSYFRCTHKYTQGCKATRQVQKLEHDPTIFQITYIGNHTCINHHIAENSSKIDPSSVIIVNSDNGTWSTSKVQEDNSPVSVKDEETANCDAVNDHRQEGPMEDLSLVWNDFIAFEGSETMYCSGESSSNQFIGLDMDQFMGMDTNHNLPLLDDGELSLI